MKVYPLVLLHIPSIYDTILGLSFCTKKWPPPHRASGLSIQTSSSSSGQHQLGPLWWQAVSPSGNPVGKESIVQVHIEVLDENDNPPEFAEPYEPKVCENAAQGKVS